MLQITSVIFIDLVASMHKRYCKHCIRFDSLKRIFEIYGQKVGNATEIQDSDGTNNYIQFQESLFGQE